MKTTISCMLTYSQLNALHVLQVWQVRLKKYGISFPIDSVPPTGVILTEEASTSVLANHVTRCIDRCYDCLERPNLPYLKVRKHRRDNADIPCVFTHCSYLHGQLESDLGYDIFEVLDINSRVVKKRNESSHEINYDGMARVKCTDTNIPCIGYFWHNIDGKQHGLICYESDLEARNYAFWCMVQQESCI